MMMMNDDDAAIIKIWRCLNKTNVRTRTYRKEGRKEKGRKESVE
jgi:hypothetical protein